MKSRGVGMGEANGKSRYALNTCMHMQTTQSSEWKKNILL